MVHRAVFPAVVSRSPHPNVRAAQARGRSPLVTNSGFSEPLDSVLSGCRNRNLSGLSKFPESLRQELSILLGSN